MPMTGEAMYHVLTKRQAQANHLHGVGCGVTARTLSSRADVEIVLLKATE